LLTYSATYKILIKVESTHLHSVTGRQFRGVLADSSPVRRRIAIHTAPLSSVGEVFLWSDRRDCGRRENSGVIACVCACLCGAHGPLSQRPSVQRDQSWRHWKGLALGELIRRRTVRHGHVRSISVITTPSVTKSHTAHTLVHRYLFLR